MRFGILGPLTVADGERPIVVPGAKPRALLVLHAGRVVPTDRLVDSLWGEHLPADPANALQAIERPPTWTQVTYTRSEDRTASAVGGHAAASGASPIRS
jgi:hypothetical protein